MKADENLMKALSDVRAEAGQLREQVAQAQVKNISGSLLLIPYVISTVHSYVNLA